MNLHFLSLASGSSGNCYYIGTDEYGILIDAGVGTRYIKKSLKDHNIALEKILALFITHDHADHIKSAGVLGEKFAIPVYATAIIHNKLPLCYSTRDCKIAFPKIIEKEKPFQLRDFTITAFEVPHDGSDNVGYQIQYGKHTFVFATDLGHITESAAKHLKTANYLVLEANYDIEMLAQGSYPYHLKMRIENPLGHLSNKEMATFVAENYTPSLQKLFLCHLSKENNHPDLALKTVEYILQSHGICVGKEIEIVALKRNSPSPYYIFEEEKIK